MSTVIDLSSLGSRGFVIQGDEPGDHAGYSVAAAGDVNDDGFGDLIVGAPYNDNAGTDAGEAYVIFGKASGFGTVDLTGLTAAQGFIVQGDSAVDGAGVSVSSAGDVNGDGFADIILGADFGSDGGTYAGQAYVIFGKASGFGTPDPAGRRVIDLTGLTPAQGFIIQGDESFDLAGSSVSSAGDVNGDGLDDMIVGARYGGGGGGAAGEAYVIFGRTSGFGTADPAGRKVVDLTGLSADLGVVIQGDAGGDEAGSSVSSAGDVNGDGFADLIVGAPLGDDGGVNAGEAYLIFGRAGRYATPGADGRQILDLTGLPAAAGFIIRGDTADDRAASSVSSAGDINADGFDDLIVGAPRGDDGGASAGEAYVIFGKASGLDHIDLSNLAPGTGFIIQGDAAADNAGGSVSSAGDVNGDGFDDVIVGASGGDDGGAAAGEAYVIFGKAGGFGTVDLTGLTAGQGFIIQGDTDADFAGVSVSGAGDVNRDGFADLIVGATGGDDGGSVAGEAYVIFGAAPTTAVTRTGTAIDQTIRGGAFNDTLSGLGGADQLFGAAGNDTLNGGTGRDRTEGGAGNDTHIVDHRTDVVVERVREGTGDRVLAETSYTLAPGVHVETLSTSSNGGTSAIHLTGNAIANRITGNAGGNILRGEGGADILFGLGGADRLYGGAGNDLLTGGTGADRFTFDTAPNASANADRIADFRPADDSLYLDRAVFAGLAADGTLAAAAYRAGTAAQDASDRIVYDAANGAIFYDADGAGGAAQILFARVEAGTALTRGDFVAFSAAAASAAPAARHPGPPAEAQDVELLLGSRLIHPAGPDWIDAQIV
ncbi:MAG TPA: hypothetical protein VGW34_11180 [Allosphingosinicella sp.]|nr:hypothetical protein [Allosphingosinicella sp.]